VSSIRWCRCCRSLENGLVPVAMRRKYRLPVSMIGTAQIHNAATGG
jgi:hypothetical protein